MRGLETKLAMSTCAAFEKNTKNLYLQRHLNFNYVRFANQ